MEVVRVPPDGAVRKVSEAVVIYKGCCGFLCMAGCTAVMAAVTIAPAVEGNAWSLFLLPMAIVLAFLTSQHCSQVELCGNGDLVLHFFVRRAATTTVEAVSSIDRDHEDGEWCVSFDGGKFRMTDNMSATSLVHALMRRKPPIVLSGYRLPEL
jgi:hypothetical protein